MRKIFYILPAAFLYACAGHKAGPAAPEPGQQALVHDSRSYALGKVPDQEREQAFQDLLVSAQAQAVKKHGAASDIGFSYSLSPKGAIYPFSEVEVSCLIQKADASQGKKLCADFFKAVNSGLKDVLAIPGREDAVPAVQ